MKRIWKWLVGLWASLRDKGIVPGKSLALRRAEAVCRFLWNNKHPSIYKLWLFGSVSRDGDGSDIDIIAEVSGETAMEFLAKLRYRLPFLSRDSNGQAEVRIGLACRIFGIDPVSVRGVCYALGKTPPMVDIFVFPPRWQSSAALQSLLPKGDPDFVKNVAGDAKIFHPDRGYFVGLGVCRTYFSGYIRLVRNVRKMLKYRMSRIDWWFRFQRGRFLRRRLLSLQ